MQKRLLMMGTTLVVALMAYLTYDRFVSEDLGPIPIDVERRAPGASGEAARWKIRIHWRDKGVSLFSNQMTEQPDGALILVPIRMRVVTSKGERVQVDGSRAIMRFRERMGGRVGGDMTPPTHATVFGDPVVVRADRRTPDDPGDDVRIYSDRFEYDAKRDLLWTKSAVECYEGINKVTGTEMTLVIPKMDPDSQSSGRRKLQRVVLDRNVRMDIHLAGDMAGIQPGAGRGPRGPAPHGTVKARRTTPITITCNGNFIYDMNALEARFYDNVRVVRQKDAEHGQMDLACDRLTVQFFRRKSSDPGGAASATEGTSLRPKLMIAQGTTVDSRFELDKERYRALGTDMRYDVLKEIATLRGEPDVVVYQGQDLIRTREMRVYQRENRVVLEGAGMLRRQEASADGTGSEDILAQWGPAGAEMRRTAAGDTAVLKQKARVRRGSESIRADYMVVKLAPATRPAGAKQAARKARGGAGRREIRGVEAAGHVVVRSTEANIDTQRLSMAIVKRPPQAPGTGPPGRGTGDGQQGAATQGAAPGKQRAADKAKPAPRIKAKKVEMTIARAGGRGDLVALKGTGDVKVDAHDGRDPVHIDGEELDLRRLGMGTFLRVLGRRKPARLKFGKMILSGRVVHFDPRETDTRMEGKGFMSFPSRTDLEGRALRKAVTVTIHWDQGMTFDGQEAKFTGNVVGTQGAARLACDRMDVLLDRRIDLTHPDRAQIKQAGLRRLYGWGRCAYDSEVRQDGKLVKSERLSSQRLVLDNTSRKLAAEGPGWVEIRQRGGRRPSASGLGVRVTGRSYARRARQDAEKDELAITHIRFARTMDADTRQNWAMFSESVRVTYRVQREPGPPPPARSPFERAKAGPQSHKDKSSGGDYEPIKLQADRLHLREHTVIEDKRPRQYNVLQAEGNAHVQRGTFRARGQQVEFDQQRDRLTISGQEEEDATLWRTMVAGGEPDTLRARKVVYFPNRDRLRVVGARYLFAREKQTVPRLRADGPLTGGDADHEKTAPKRPSKALF